MTCSSEQWSARDPPQGLSQHEFERHGFIYRTWVPVGEFGRILTQLRWATEPLHWEHVEFTERQAARRSEGLGRVVSTGRGSEPAFLGRSIGAAAGGLVALGVVRCKPGAARGRIRGRALSESRGLVGGWGNAPPHQYRHNARGPGQALRDVAEAPALSDAECTAKRTDARIRRRVGLVPCAVRQRTFGAIAPRATDVAADPRPAARRQHPGGCDGPD